MRIKELLNSIDSFAPFFLQESYDNSGIQFGDEDAEINKIVLALDVSKGSVDFAIKNDANVLLTHHPILFFATKRITKREKPLLYKAITNGLNIIAAHTNFDIAENGLNDYVGNLLGIKKESSLQPAAEKIYKFSFYVPRNFANSVREAVFNAGAGKIGGYDKSSFNIEGIGTFRSLEGTDPFIGEIGKLSKTEETKVETVVTERNLGKVINALLSAHPYEEPAYDVFELKRSVNFGVGMKGVLEKTYSLAEFAGFVKETLNARYVRFVGCPDASVKKVALCTGAGSSLVESVAGTGTDVFITGDITYHTAMRAREIGLNLIDVEHFDTEKFFACAMEERLKDVLPDNIDIIKFENERSPFEIL